jgi:hypothetical protein
MRVRLNIEVGVKTIVAKRVGIIMADRAVLAPSRGSIAKIPGVLSNF